MATISVTTAPAYAELGDRITLTAIVKDDTGALSDATMAITATKPDGTAASPPAPTHVTTGTYTSAVTTDQSGVWPYTWSASGTQVAVESGQFEVRALQVYVVSLEELKRQLNRTDNSDDQELRTYLASATRYVESRLGGPVSVQTFTERHFIDSDIIIPRKRPLVSVTSVTPDFGGALATTAYVVDTELNRIQFYWGIAGWSTIVYKAGFAFPSENARLSGMMVAQHLWDTQNGFAGRRNTDELVQTGLGFAVPRRAEELLGVSGDAISGVA